MKVKELEKLDELLKYYKDMEHRFACVVDHATGGHISKTNYELHVYYECINEAKQREFEDLLKDELEGRSDGD